MGSPKDIFSELQLPLSELLRPKTLAEYIGQRHLINSPNGEITNFLSLGYLPSMLLCGPPGVGKTSIARLLADNANYVFVELSATDSTVADLRELLGEIRAENLSRLRFGLDRLRVVVFIDEIHRFTSVQQDFLLLFIESGDFVFIGATTVEPEKRIRRAIMSRCQHFRLVALSEEDVFRVIRRAVLFQNIKRKSCLKLRFLKYSDESMANVAKYANGDMRAAINVIEVMSLNYQGESYIENGDEMVSVSAQDVRRLIDSLTKARFGLAHTSSLPLVSLLLSTIVRSEKPPIEPISRNILTSSPVRRVEKVSKFQSNHDWDQHMLYSDDSDVEPGQIYSDDESDVDEGPVKYDLIRAIECVLRLLRNGESPYFIIKNLILHACKLHPQDAELVKLVSAFKCLQKADSDTVQLLINCVEILMGKTMGEDEPLVSIIRSVKQFIENTDLLPPKERADKMVLNVTYDDVLVEKLVNGEEGSREESDLAPLEVVSIGDLPLEYTTGGDLELWSEILNC